MMTCEQTREIVTRLPDTEANTAAVREHLQRCPACRALADFTRQALELPPVVTGTPGLGPILLRAAARRKRRLVWRVAALALVGVVAASAWGIGMRQQRPAESSAELVLAWDGIESKLVELEAAIDADMTAWKQQMAIN